MKPRIGTYFQAAVPAFNPNPREDSDNVSTSSISISLPSGPKKKRAGRPPKGGRAIKQGESSQVSWSVGCGLVFIWRLMSVVQCSAVVGVSSIRSMTWHCRVRVWHGLYFTLTHTPSWYS